MTTRVINRWSGAIAAMSMTLMAIMFAVPAGATGTNVVYRARLGNNTEGITIPMMGRWANDVIAIDGYDVMAIEVESRHPAPSKKIFDVRASGIGGPPRGIVHVPTQRRFYFAPVEQSQVDRLFVTDESGAVLPPLTIHRSAGHSEVLQYEGMTWIPASSPRHPNTIAAVVADAVDFTGHIDFIRLDGTVEEEVVPARGTPLEAWITGIAYRAPGELLVTLSDQGTYVMDLDGSLVGTGPFVTLPEAGDVEGTAVGRDGRVFETSYATGHVFAFGRDGARRVADDRMFVIGLGIPTQYLTWDSDHGQFVFQVSEFSNGSEVGSLVTASADLTSKAVVAALDPSHFNSARGIGYLGAGLVAVTNAGTPRGVGIVDLVDGSETSFLPIGARPVAAAPLPNGDIALRVRGTPNVQVIDRNGTAQPQITLSADPCGDVVFFSCGALTAFDSGHGPELFTGTSFFGLDGQLHDRIDVTALGLLDVQGAAYITSGPWAGMFAVMESQTSTIAVFTR
jgi:hypothetical protein